MDKYDRQIRLWSKAGQSALSSAHILVLGVRTTTTEMVKCLALSGVARITLCDESPVTQDTLASNFFANGPLGTNIAHSVAPQLAELNPDITIDIVAKPDFKVGYSVICVANATSRYLDELYQYAPVVELCSFGFYGRVRAFYRQYTSFQTHPPTLVDLRFDWPELAEYLNRQDLDNLSKYEHENVPFTTILGKYAQQGIPQTLAEKKALKAALNNRAGPEGDNWREAANAAFHLWTVAKPKYFELIDANLNKNPTSFWLLMAALREFHQTSGQLPLSGVLPDMKTDNKYYVEVQQLYRAKASADVEQMRKHLAHICAALNAEEPSQEQLRTFCKNARHLLVIDGVPPLRNTEALLAIKGDAADPYDALMLHQQQIFAALELACAEREWPLTSNTIDQRVLNELNRSSGGELNAVASIVGGMAAQEVTKLLLDQYTPIKHTLVYDGTKSTAYTF